MSEPPLKRRSKRAKSDYHYEVGARIVQARNDRGLTQEELAALLRVSQRTMQSYENGEVLVPHKHRAALAKHLRRSVSWILRGEEGSPEMEGTEIEEWLAGFEKKVDERLSKLDGTLGVVALELRKLEQQIRGLARRLDEAESQPVEVD